MRSLLGIPAAAFAFLTMTGCVVYSDWGDSDRYKEDFHKSYPLRSGGTISVESFNGSVELIGWDQASVEVDATKYASTRRNLDDLKIVINASNDALHIRTERPSWTLGGMGVRYTIRVPKKAVLDRIQSSNGAVKIEDVDGPANLTTSNGSIHVTGMHGDLDVHTSNGGIGIRDLVGNANLRTSNGTIDAEAKGGRFEAVTSNGRIEARLTDPSPNSTVRLESSNGHIELTLDARKTPDVRAETNNSSILLRLNESANARVHAHTSHGSVTSDFDELRPENSRERHEVEGTIGGGGALIDLSSSNGPIRIVKR